MLDRPNGIPDSVKKIEKGAPPVAREVSIKTENLAGLPPVDTENTMNAQEIAFGTSHSSVSTEKLTGVPPQNAENTFAPDHFKNVNDNVPDSHTALQNGKTLAETREELIAFEAAETAGKIKDIRAQIENVLQFPEKTSNSTEISRSIESHILNGRSFSFLLNQGVEGMRQLGMKFESPDIEEKAKKALEKYLQKNNISPETLLAAKGNEQVSKDIADTISSYIELAAQNPELAKVA